MREPAIHFEGKTNIPPLKKNHLVFRLIGGNIISFFGDQIYMIALPLTVLAVSGSAMSMGIVAALERVPVLLQPLTGILSDRLNRKWLLIGCDIGRAILIGFIALMFITNQLMIWHVFCCAFIIGLLSQIYNTSQFATIPHLARKEDLPTINAINTGSFNSVTMIAPGLGGIIISLMNPGFALLINSISFILAALTVISIPYTYEISIRKELQQKSIKEDLIEGFRFVIKTKPILITNIAQLFSIFGLTLFLTILVFHLKDTIHLSAKEIGLLLSVGGGAAVLGAISSSYLKEKYTYQKILFYSSFVGGLSIVFFGFIDTLISLIILNAVGTFAASIKNPCIITIRQRVTPDHLLGRVQATSRFMTWGFVPIAAFLSGLFSAYFGTAVTIIIGGMIATIAAFLFIHPALDGIND
ncbi:MFS transporter [Pseudalkalibacillus sp. SCS-8]|uniref:MFS transporter n=1 Tax=Pseudalkalibacillus nanhaiensis TaxID=3115291 RepID=UPI0032DA4915